ncbi:MAG TPA: PQ-loop repeat-containing protein [Pyrinomonadaceae bacterium]|nr:PQ-loop repeat-containing protein [Pyrinomonadaceae bacterium]
MTLRMEMLGWVGTALVIVAYVPQIRHLYVEKCAWGISISTWLIWLVAGALLLSYCVFRNDTLFTFVQIINITAIAATIILARRSNRICPYHLKTTLAARDEDLAPRDKKRQTIQLQEKHNVVHTNTC